MIFSFTIAQNESIIVQSGNFFEDEDWTIGGASEDEDGEEEQDRTMIKIILETNSQNSASQVKKRYLMSDFFLVCVVVSKVSKGYAL